MLPTASSQSTESMHMELRSLDKLLFFPPQATDLDGSRCFCKESKYFILFFSVHESSFFGALFIFHISLLLTVVHANVKCPLAPLVRNFTICRLQIAINFCLLWEESCSQAAPSE